MATVLYAGCGDLAISSAAQMTADGHQCLGLRRNPSKLPGYIQGIAADLSNPSTIPHFPEPIDYVVVTLTPGEFSSDAYQRAYVDGLSHLLNRLSLLKTAPKHILFASSTSVYHQNNSEWVDENSPTKPSSFSGKAMLAAEAILLESAFNTTSIRFSGIYGPQRERMLHWANAGAMAPETPVHFSNRIHREDCAGVISHLLTLAIDGQSLESCYLASDDQPSTFAEVLDWLRTQLGVTANPDAEQTKKIRTGSKRCRNARLKNTGYQLRYPTFRDGYAPMVTTYKAKQSTN